MPKKTDQNLALTDSGTGNSTYSSSSSSSKSSSSAAAPTYVAQQYTGYTPYTATQYGGYADFTYDPFDQQEYNSEYKQSIDNALNTLQNRVNAGFSYDSSTDPTYQQYEKSYTRNGRSAMEDTLARQASKTGGVASSYASSAANQAYLNYMAELADKIPELRQLAYNEWSNTNDAYSNLATQYGTQDDREYNRWKNYEDQRYNIYQDEKDDAYNNYVFARDADYANWEAREAANKLSYQAQQEAALTNYNASVDAYNQNYENALNKYYTDIENEQTNDYNQRLVNAYIGDGDVPTRSEILTKAAETVAAANKDYNDAIASSTQQKNYSSLYNELKPYITSRDSRGFSDVIEAIRLNSLANGDITQEQYDKLKDSFNNYYANY